MKTLKELEIIMSKAEAWAKYEKAKQAYKTELSKESNK